MQGIISKCILSVCCIDENNPSLTETKAGLILGILATYTMYRWKFYDLHWARSWMSALNSHYMAVLLMIMMPALLK